MTSITSLILNLFISSYLNTSSSILFISLSANNTCRFMAFVVSKKKASIKKSNTHTTPAVLKALFLY